MLNSAALKAALVALVSQAAAIAVLYGVVNSDEAAQWSTLAFGLINAAFLIAHALHSHTAAVVASGLPSDALELASQPPAPAPVPPAVSVPAPPPAPPVA